MSALRRAAYVRQSDRRGTARFPLGQHHPPRLGNRGFVLISSYLILSLFLVYSSTLSIRMLGQRLTADHFRDGLQALDLAQGASQQLQERFHEFLTSEIYQNYYAGNAISALEWLDSLGEVLSGDKPKEKDQLLFDLDGNDARDATSSDNAFPVLGLPTIRTATDATAWLVSITNPGGGMLDPRRVTIEAVGRVGTMTKRIRTTYQVGLGMSDIFRYAYFLNNYGWMDAQGNVLIHGEVRSNGDLRFSGNVTVNGDLYASENSDVHDPTDPESSTSQGLILGDPYEWSALEYWGIKNTWGGQWKGARPNKRLVLDGQPTIAGDAGILPYGYGYETQDKFQEQPMHPMPYLGDLSIYKKIAKNFKNPGPDGQLGTPDDTTGSTLVYYNTATGVVDGMTRTINEKYENNEPLVLVGTASNPIEINGPVVAKGDVIIKGYVKGQGTIYAGRNIHVVGDVTYLSFPEWPTLERNSATGEIRAKMSSGSTVDVGSVCADGTVLPVGSSCP